MDLFKELNGIFCLVFNDPDIIITPETTANDIERWDSLSHANLILTIETHFKIRFSNKEILKWNNVGEMVEGIRSKLQS